MSKSRTTSRRPAGASTRAAKPRARRAKTGTKPGRAHCAMPACEAPRIAGKAHCSAHARQARERLRVAAGEAAWA
jgi:hypothetical protein